MAHSESKILPLNQDLDISPDEAVYLWKKSVEPPSNRGFHEDDVAMSADGKLIIKRKLVEDCIPPISIFQLNPLDICQIATSEIEKLRHLGLAVISRAIVPNPEDARSIFSITPYIPGIMSCSRQSFMSFTVPILTSYVENRPQPEQGRDYLLEDIFKNAQYSQLIEDGDPFLHDPEPTLEYRRSLVEARLNSIH